MAHRISVGRAGLRLLWASALFISACGEPPETRLLAAMEAAEMKDMDAFTAQFTERSSGLIVRLHEVSSRTRGELTYLADLFSILPKGSVQGVEEDGETAVVVVGTETGTSEVVLLKEGGEWKIDAMSLPRMWKPAGGDG